MGRGPQVWHGGVQEAHQRRRAPRQLRRPPGVALEAPGEARHAHAPSRPGRWSLLRRQLALEADEGPPWRRAGGTPAAARPPAATCSTPGSCTGSAPPAAALAAASWQSERTSLAAGRGAPAIRLMPPALWAYSGTQHRSQKCIRLQNMGPPPARLTNIRGCPPRGCTRASRKRGEYQGTLLRPTSISYLRPTVDGMRDCLFPLPIPLLSLAGEFGLGR
ncbi:unnamed protein product [Prorocentrum cordatum]|uniref:Uncharacterized protein n=1 Tax=Prorocentrum cordatum TaxID=2364126 RepID=A0ABN9Y838_9DINO|nr:unnamed protein product [Polarella glacialis]